MFSPTDTIVAIATAPVRAGIGVVRISGPRAHDVARAILTVRHELEPRHATLTHARGTAAHALESVIPNPQSPIPLATPKPREEASAPDRGEGGSPEPQTPTIDEVVVTYFPAPPASADNDSGAGFGAAPPRQGAIDEVVVTYFPAPPASAGNDSGAGFGAAPPRQGAIDEVVVTYFPAPHSYTAEDVVEISAHGSVALLREIVRAAVAAGARLAEPGEFTLRAFLNGRLDLVQAEAVADLVDAVTPLQARVAFDQLEGTLTRAIGALDRELFDLAARLEASVDFPDEGYHFVAPGEAAAVLQRVRDGVDALLATSPTGRVIREGRHVAILGKPNVGKSSLFNQLVGTDRAIVAPGPGTTRDMLRETIDLDGIRLGLVDTAGIRASDDEVEQEGVARARGAASVADLVLLVLDRSRPLEASDRALLRETAAVPRVVVVNKIDLAAAWEASDAAIGARDSGLPPSPNGLPAGSGATGGTRDGDNERPPPPRAASSAVLLSLKTGEGLDELRAAMRDALDVAEPLRDAPMITNVRHEALLRDARASVARAIENLEQAGESASEELVLADLATARKALEEVTGKRTTEDLLRTIFERFCVGK